MKTKSCFSKKTMGELAREFIESQSITATASKFLIALLAMGPLLVIGSAVPNLILATNKYRQKSNYSSEKIKNAYNNLKQRKYIQIIGIKKGKIQIKLTNKGHRRFKEFVFEELKIEKPKKWDKKWRILTFDIPIKPRTNNKAREALRWKIKELGFFQIQKSVWVYPYECEDELLFIAEIFNVQKYIEVITAERLLHEKELKNKFGL